MFCGFCSQADESSSSDDGGDSDMEEDEAGGDDGSSDDFEGDLLPKPNKTGKQQAKQPAKQQAKLQLPPEVCTTRKLQNPGVHGAMTCEHLYVLLRHFQLADVLWCSKYSSVIEVMLRLLIGVLLCTLINVCLPAPLQESSEDGDDIVADYVMSDEDDSMDGLNDVSDDDDVIEGDSGSGKAEDES